MSRRRRWRNRNAQHNYPVVVQQPQWGQQPQWQQAQVVPARTESHEAVVELAVALGQVLKASIIISYWLVVGAVKVTAIGFYVVGCIIESRRH
jgi:hypothetical protein